MKRTLILSTTSYAGMGPYVSEIVNQFSAQDDIYYFFTDHEDDFIGRTSRRSFIRKVIFIRRIVVNGIKSEIYFRFARNHIHLF